MTDTNAAIDGLQGREIQTPYADPQTVACEIAGAMGHSEITDALEVGFGDLAETPFEKWSDFPEPATAFGAGSDGYAELVEDMTVVTPETIAERYGEEMVELATVAQERPACPQTPLAAVVSVVTRGFHGHIVQDRIIDEVDELTRASVEKESLGIDGYLKELAFDVKKNDLTCGRSDKTSLGVKEDNVELLISFAVVDNNTVRIGIEPTNTDNDETASHSIARATSAGTNPDSAETWDVDWS